MYNSLINKKIGVIGTPDNWSSLKLAETIERKTGYKCFINMSEVFFDLERGEIFSPGTDVSSLDAIIIKKLGKNYSPNFLNRLEILDSLSNKSIRIFSNPRKIMQVLNRLSCTLKLRSGNIPTPPTILTENIEEAVHAVSQFKKAVLKPLFTTKARGMIVVEATNGSKAQIEEFQNNGNKLIYVQKYLKIPGKDLGIVFLGGEYIATYARIAGKDSWNTTTHSGGKYERYEPAKETIELAHKAQALFGLDFTSVDLVETLQGPRVFEVSAFGGFRGLLEACDIDAAELFADYVLEKLNNA